MSLTKKLLSSFGAMLGLVLLLGAGGLYLTHDLAGDLDRAANVTARHQFLAGQVSAGAAELTSLARGSVLAAMLADTAHQQSYQDAFRPAGGVTAHFARRVAQNHGRKRRLGPVAESGTAGGVGGSGS